MAIEEVVSQNIFPFTKIPYYFINYELNSVGWCFTFFDLQLLYFIRTTSCCQVMGLIQFVTLEILIFITLRYTTPLNKYLNILRRSLCERHRRLICFWKEFGSLKQTVYFVLFPTITVMVCLPVRIVCGYLSIRLTILTLHGHTNANLDGVEETRVAEISWRSYNFYSQFSFNA